MAAKILAVSSALPDKVISNEQLALEYPDWTVEKIYNKTGIMNRHVVEATECASDLAVKAAEKLFLVNSVNRESIDYILFCTQSPDYRLPTSACLIQDRLRIPLNCGALDFNLGCSGFVYGLSLAKGLIETGSATNVLLLTGDTYSKYINPGDRSVRTIFGDAGTAALISSEESAQEFIGPFVLGTDGSGGKNLIVPAGGARKPIGVGTPIEMMDDTGCIRSEENLFMNGSEVFSFTLRSVANSIGELLKKSQKKMEDIDLFVFHQANKYMLETLRVKCKIPEEKFIFALRDVGNTVSSTIPIALEQACDIGTLKKGMRVLLAGFGVGYSWGACLVEW